MLAQTILMLFKANLHSLFNLCIDLKAYITKKLWSECFVTVELQHSELVVQALGGESQLVDILK